VRWTTCRCKGLFFTVDHPGRLWYTPSLLFNEYRALFPLGVKWSEREADNLPPSSAKAKFDCSYSYTLSESLHGVHRDWFFFFRYWFYLHELKFGIFLAVVIYKEIPLEYHRVWSLWRTFRGHEIREHCI